MWSAAQGVAATLESDAVWAWSSIVFLVAVLGEVLAAVFVYRVLTRGGSPASTLLWVAVILLAPWFGLLLYYLLPRRLQLRKLRMVRRRGGRLRAVQETDDDEAAAGDLVDVPSAGAAGLEALLARGGATTGGNRVRWLSGGEEFFAAAAAAIAGARSHVHCVVYILRPDETGLRFLAVLADAARRGVQVRLCYDSFGSWGLKAHHLAALRAAGGRAEPFLPLLWKRRPFTVNLRNHRKLLIVDGEVGFVGGRNVGDEYRTDRVGRTRRWFDAMLELRGPAVDRLQEVFVQDWCTAADEALPDLGPAAPSHPDGERVAVVFSGPDREQSMLWFAMVQAIGEAGRTVDLSSPYLVLPSTLLFALQLAAARGVRVSVRTNGQSAEAPVLYHAQRHHYRRLLEAGIEVRETLQEYNHAKFLVLDGRTVFVGSHNMDLRSAHLNFEIAAVALDSPELAEQVLATVAERDVGFRSVAEGDLPRDPLRRAIDGLCGLFSPLL
ncbi:MAG: PLDc N-terminal domain-containing protein [Planctomycetes bacterium]|nr:PLDc N-terminal domain-containing protein [Planctomycetota bacterium]